MRGVARVGMVRRATCAETLVMVTCDLQPNIAVKTAQALPVATGSQNRFKNG